MPLVTGSVSGDMHQLSSWDQLLSMYASRLLRLESLHETLQGRKRYWLEV